MRNYLWVFLSILFLFPTQKTFAASSYVLPYPSSMPGNFVYKVHQFEEAILKFWYFGDFGQFDFNMKESDKYLVEAKTLFDYQQYLLAEKALQKSNRYFRNIPSALASAKKHGKDIVVKKKLFTEAAEKHIEVLTKLKNDIPEVFIWQPEFFTQTKLLLHKDIDQSIDIRKQYL